MDGPVEPQLHHPQHFQAVLAQNGASPIRQRPYPRLSSFQSTQADWTRPAETHSWDRLSRHPNIAHCDKSLRL
ncbi:hypothetical protein VUR80DRAFT_6920 [Thermomyces stellatus]